MACVPCHLAEELKRSINGNQRFKRPTQYAEAYCRVNLRFATVDAYNTRSVTLTEPTDTARVKQVVASLMQPEAVYLR
ncbi:hypothetical protein OKW35_001683 [Paraburkholderia sp. MM5477-R1]